MLALNVLVRKCWGYPVWSCYKTSVLLEGIPNCPQARKRLNTALILKSGTAVFLISVVNKENILRKPGRLKSSQIKKYNTQINL